MTFKEIYEEFYDKEQDSLVDVPKTLAAGGSTIVEDRISGVKFDEESDATFFYVNDGRTPVELPFRGDQTSKFAQGDTVKFKFTLKAVSEGPDFVGFDYIDAIDNTGEFPSLDDLLVN